MSGTWSAAVPPSNEFFLPREVFELGLDQGPLLVYIYLVYQKSLKHSPNQLSCTVISKAVGLCEKTVRRHLQMLADAGLIWMEHSGQNFSYSLCPIWDKVWKRRGKAPLSMCEGGRSA